VERARPAPAVSKAAAVVPQAPLPVVTVRSTGFLKSLRAAPAGRISMAGQRISRMSRRSSVIEPPDAGADAPEQKSVVGRAIRRASMNLGQMMGRSLSGEGDRSAASPTCAARGSVAQASAEPGQVRQAW
jgi:hypothetical protein